MTIQSLERVLARHTFLADLRPDLREFIVGCAGNRRFSEGEFLFRHGEPANQFFLIRAGLVAVELSLPGQPDLVLQTVAEDQVLGWSWVVPPYVHRFDARVAKPVRAIVFDGQCLRDKFDEEPELGYEMLRRFVPVISSRLEAARMQLMDLYGDGRAD